MSDIRHAPVVPTQTQQRASGEMIDRHRHDHHQFAYVSTGVVAVGTAAGAWVASADRGVWIPAGMWHEHRFYGASAFHAVAFPAGPAPLPADAPTVVSVSPLLRELLMACTDPALSEVEKRRVRAVVNDQLRRASVKPITVPSARDPRLAETCALVAADLSRPLSLAALAARTGTSERTLARLFRDEFGMTYPQWRNSLRVYHAMIALSEGASVTETAHRCGWATPSAFIDVFRRSMGQTPGAYQTHQ
jgi:AraC-like DNA-binding protein